MLINQLWRAAEGGAVDRGLGAGVLGGLCSGAGDLSRAAARDCRRLPKHRVIDSEEVARLWDERERIDGKKIASATAREEKAVNCKKPTR